jgi:hypothetical protein
MGNKQDKQRHNSPKADLRENTHTLRHSLRTVANTHGSEGCQNDVRAFWVFILRRFVVTDVSKGLLPSSSESSSPKRFPFWDITQCKLVVTGVSGKNLSGLVFMGQAIHEDYLTLEDGTD